MSTSELYQMKIKIGRQTIRQQVMAQPQCDEFDHKKLTTLLKSHFHSNNSTRGKLKVLLACRSYRHVTSGFNELDDSFPNMRIPGEDESPRIAEEINIVIKDRVQKFEEAQHLKKGSLNYLEKRLMQTKHRTYLWLYLVFNYLENELVKSPEKEMEKRIFNNIPASFNEIYERILEKSRCRERARIIFSVLLAAYRPLTVGEMQIAFELDRASRSPSDIDLEDAKQFKGSLRDYCGLFVSINNGKVYFLHQTAQEFLLQNMQSEDPSHIYNANNNSFHHSISIQKAHSLLAEHCITYVRFQQSLVKTSKSNSKFNYNNKPTNWNLGDEHDNMHSFLHYALTNWVIHLFGAKEQESVDEVDEEIPHRSLELCNVQSKDIYPWFKMYWEEEMCGSDYPEPSNLATASFFGLRHIAQLLLETGQVDVNSKDTGGWAPL